MAAIKGPRLYCTGIVSSFTMRVLMLCSFVIWEIVPIYGSCSALWRCIQGRPKTPKPIQGAANGTKNRTPHISPRTTRATPALSLQRILLDSCLCLCFGRHHLQARHNKAAYHKPQTSSMRTESLITCLISRRFLQSNCHDVQLLLRLLRYSRQSDAPRSYRQKDISGNRSE